MCPEMMVNNAIKKMIGMGRRGLTGLGAKDERAKRKKTPCQTNH